MYAHKDIRIEFTRGKNYIVGPIGSGKTEVLQGIGFAFFGTVALRDKATSYKNIYVELSFNYKEETFLIKRKINDASFLMLDSTNNYEEVANSTSGVNQRIISLLGYNYDIFLLSNFCQQKKLSYFSDLTPAKRLQYIDKISGIEEAKDLLKHLTIKRKTLKDNLALLKDVTIEPKLNSNIDLSFDYLSSIDFLNTKLNSISSLYTEYTSVLESRSYSISKPLFPISDKNLSYYNLDESLYKDCIDYLSNINSLESEINSLTDILNSLPKINSKLKNISLNEVLDKINLFKINTIYSSSDNIKITCSSCNATHDLKPLLNAPESLLDPIDIKDLYNLQTYLEGGYDTIREETERSIRKKKRELEYLLENELIINLSLLSTDQFIKKISDNDSMYSLYLENLTSYNNQEENNNKILEEANSIKETIDKLIEEQSEDIKLKDTYIQYNTEKNLYLEQYLLYEQAQNKVNEFKIELDLVNNLIKEINNITLFIKNQTIPLINYHASRFLNLITKGRMNSIEITDNYDLIVDGYKIDVRSGGQQDMASLAFRLSLSQSIISGMLPLFLADEIDSSGGKNDSNDIMEALDTISESNFQIIMVTHEDTSNLENINIIQL